MSPDRQRAGHGADRRACWRSWTPPSTRWPAWTRTGSCGPSSPSSRRPCARTSSRRQAGGEPHAYVSMKFDPQAIPDLPAPRPAYEIWVYSPRVEGVHLRFGKVARGGLRWSDRREDFRTEILGLVKAQMVKNTVIVPVGAKGGFVAKQLPDPARGPRRLAGRGHRQLQDLHLGAARHHRQHGRPARSCRPPDVVRHDEDDTYLVVAADKGTATFSDIANEVAESLRLLARGRLRLRRLAPATTTRGMGITARGAWESVKRHFRELGHDTQTEDFTVVGVGDMSGDVFGNGMLLCEHIRLVAAFDHRHIFIDPNPDAATSLRRAPPALRAAALLLGRLQHRAALAGRRHLPAHGQVHPDQRAHPRGPRHRGRASPKMTPADLMQAILKAPVDLLWNGGIGTYVKASHRDARRRRRQGQRRDPRRRRGPAGQGRRRGRQPRPDPARPDRVRAGRAARSTPTPSTTARAWTPPTTR